jgi:hypothetical protein
MQSDAVQRKTHKKGALLHICINQLPKQKNVANEGNLCQNKYKFIVLYFANIEKSAFNICKYGFFQ